MTGAGRTAGGQLSSVRQSYGEGQFAPKENPVLAYLGSKPGYGRVPGRP